MKTDSGLRSAILPADDRPLEPVEQAGDAAPAPQQVAPAPPFQPLPFSPRTRVGVLAIIGLLAFLFLLRIASILTPFLWAIVVAYAVNPLIRVLCRRTHLPRAAIVSAVYLALVGALAGLLAVAIPRINAQVTQLANDLPTIVSDLQLRYFGTTHQSVIVLGFSVDVPSITRQVANSLNSALNDFAGGTFTAVVSTIERLAQFLLFLIVTFYLLLDAPKIGGYLTRALPQRHRAELLDVARQVDHVLSQYLRAQLLLIAIMSTASFVVLTVMGVRFAFVLAPVVGVLEIFPVIGPFAAITLVTLIALLSAPNYGLSHTGSALIVALVFFILRQLEDYAVIPNVVGHAVRLHPALILFAVAAGATFGGALGLFLAVPVTGALKVLGGYLYQKLDLK